MNKKSRILELSKMLDALPDSDEFIHDNDYFCFVTDGWLFRKTSSLKGFSSRGFQAKTKLEAIEQLLDYFDSHIGHKSMVGDIVTESGWPDLSMVKSYIQTDETTPGLM